MGFRFVISSAFIAILSTQAVAQNAGDMINMFSTIMRAAMVDHARTEWSTLSPNETSCIEQGLQQQGSSIGGFIQSGIAPSDPRLSGIRSGCRTPTAALPSPKETIDHVEDLSAKPTFDCTRAKTPTGRILCLDQAGAKADWDLTSALWARTFSLDETARDGFNQTHEAWLQTLNRDCRLSAGQSTFSPAQRQCILGSFRKRAELYRSQLSGDALAEAILSPEQRAQIQLQLKALGYLNGEADGEFGPNTRGAIKRFQAQAGLSESDFLTAQQRQQLLPGKSSGPTELSNSELTLKASLLSPNEAANQCQSADADKRLVGCTAIINARGKGFSTTIADAFDGRCWAFNDLGQYDRGLADCKASISINPRYSYAYTNLGNSLLGLADVSSAITAFKKSIDLKPNFVYAYLGRARAFAASGDQELARNDYKTALILDPTNQQARDGLLALDSPAQGAAPAASPKETVRLREAHVFLEDARKFISIQKAVPSISMIANEAATLQISLDKFDENSATQSMKRLSDLLKIITGFDEFEKQQQSDRQREEVRRLSEAKSNGIDNIDFIDSYIKDHLGDSKTASLTIIREQIDAALRRGSIEDINSANDALKNYVNSNGLANLYQKPKAPTADEIQARAALERKRKDDELLEAERTKARESQKVVIEQRLRQQNGAKARALMNDIHEFVKALAEKREANDDHHFASYSSWLNRRFADQWETYNVISEVADFGTVQWQERPLEAVIVKSVVQQKNRILGKYDSGCFMFGLVDDPEFAMQRDPLVVDCDSSGSIGNWKVGKSFQSKWNAN